MFYGYVYSLADGNPVVVLCKSELEVERSISSQMLATDEDFDAFHRSLSTILPTELM